MVVCAHMIVEAVATTARNVRARLRGAANTPFDRGSEEQETDECHFSGVLL